MSSNKLELHKVWRDDKYGLADENNNIVIPCIWEDVEPFSNGLAKVLNSKGLYGFVNKKGKLVVPCEWDSAESFKKGQAKVRREERDYLIDKSGIIKEEITSEATKKRLAKKEADRKRRESKKQEQLESTLKMLHDFYERYGVKAQFIYVKNYARSTNLFVVPAINDQVVSFYAYKDFGQDYYDRAMQLVVYLNELTSIYGKTKVQKKDTLPKEAKDALDSKLEELDLKDRWRGIFNESQRHYLRGKYQITAAIS